jgi:S-adenosylmethionine synthetase
VKQDFMFISESVTEGHPDKLCDQIADAVLDHLLEEDPYSQAVIECAVATGVVFIAARYRSRAAVDVPAVARQVIHQTGYDQKDFNARTSSILTSLSEMPGEAPARVDERELSDEQIERIPARHPATVFGYACDQTPALMPLPIWLAHKLARRLTAVRHQKEFAWLRPDGKTQIGVEYRARRPARIHSLTLLAALSAEAPAPERVREALIEEVVKPVFRDEPVAPDAQTAVYVNPDGPFRTGGPSVHSGLTGRKNAIDTYGEYSRHSGAALSGKDPSRIDRVGAYAARYAAKNIVAAGLARECELQLSYSIGLARPVSVQVETFGTGRLADDEIAARLERCVDFRPAGIVRAFNLRHLPRTVRGFYRRLAAYGHVGRMDIGLPWESVDKTALLREEPAATHGKRAREKGG